MSAVARLWPSSVIAVARLCPIADSGSVAHSTPSHGLVVTNSVGFGGGGVGASVGTVVVGATVEGAAVVGGFLCKRIRSFCRATRAWLCSSRAACAASWFGCVGGADDGSTTDGGGVASDASRAVTI